MRRLIVALLALALVVPVVAVAQQQYGQGFVLNRANTAVTIANSTTATSIYSFLVPAVTWANFTPQQYGATNLHLVAIGTVSTNPSAGSVGTINVGCNYGGTTATISLANAVTLTQNLSASPLILNLWLRTTSTGAPQLTGQLAVTSASVVSVNGGVSSNGPSLSTATVTGTTSTTTAQTLACAWQWASAAATNTVTIGTAVLVIGD